jgi:hypothetical protein
MEQLYDSEIIGSSLLSGKRTEEDGFDFEYEQ